MYYPDDYLDTAFWFVAKGASLGEFWPYSRTAAVHCLGWGLGLRSRGVRYGKKSKDSTLLDIATIPLNGLPDDCKCFCSSGGCAFVHTFFKGLQIPPGNPHFRSSSIENWIQPNTDLKHILRSVMVSLNDGRSEWMVPELLRLIIFNELGLRHTCCKLDALEHHGHDEADPEAIPSTRYSVDKLAEISEEDAFLREQLVKLLDEFLADFRSFDGDLEMFVSNEVLPEIATTLQRLKDEEQRLYAAGRMDIGVRMHQPEG